MHMRKNRFMISKNAELYVGLKSGGGLAKPQNHRISVICDPMLIFLGDCGATDAYGYNGRNEVVSARRTLGGSPVAGFNEDFAYDPIGNRISATDYDETGAARTSTYTANALNQYTARTVPGWVSVRGLVDADATVAVNGNPAYALASGDLAYFFGSDDFDNSATGGFAELEVSATISDGINDLVSVATNRVFVPPANETYAYDADGNQTLVTTGTGAWQVEYNGENRPVRWTCGDKVLHMAYDHQGRRRFYVEVTAGVTNKLHRFTYDDYVCIARNREIDAQHGFGSDAFVWDPTEPIATRPLMCNPSMAPPLLYCQDGNKNVSEAVTPDATIAAHYEYSSFGKVVLVTSENESQTTANLNPYRFSSEYADDALGLVYYNYRHYNSVDGRWSARDFIENMLQLYCFAENESIREYDYLGLRCTPGTFNVLDISITETPQDRQNNLNNIQQSGDALMSSLNDFTTVAIGASVVGAGSALGAIAASADAIAGMGISPDGGAVGSKTGGVVGNLGKHGLVRIDGTITFQLCECKIFGYDWGDSQTKKSSDEVSIESMTTMQEFNKEKILTRNRVLKDLISIMYDVRKKKLRKMLDY